MKNQRLLKHLLAVVAVVWLTGSNLSAQESYVRIENRWKPNLQINVEAGPTAATKAAPGWHSADWVFEPAGRANTYRIRNRYKGTYLNIEKGTLESSKVPPAFVSSQWILEPVDNFCRIKNAWKGTYLHVQNGVLDCGKIEPGWTSAQWNLKGFGVSAECQE